VITDENRRDDYPMATMETANATTQANEEAIYAGLPQTRVLRTSVASYPTDNTTSPNDYVAKLQAITGSQKIGPSITLKVMKGDSINIRVSSWYKLGTSTPTTPPINTTLANIVSSLISGISGSAVVNTHGVTSSQFNTAGSFTPDVTSFLNNQTNTNYNTAKPKAYLNWIYFDEQFNIVSSSSNAEQVGNDQQFKLHVQQTVATKCGFLYVYVSNETPNIPVYFDNLQVSHVRSPLLETSEYYAYGLKMANISYRAASTLTNRYGWNGGNEYEDEGELNYSNTFYRKYDAQIGRFTGVDMKAEEFAYINPYQFGGNNPVMFNDPMGDAATSNGGGDKNPASCSDIQQLLNYVQNFGISGFSDEFNRWTFGGHGQMTSFANGNNFSLSNDGASIRFNWMAMIYNGDSRSAFSKSGEGGESKSLNTLVFGSTKMSVQSLWNHAMSWGEKHRDATYQWYNGKEHYDVMWRHNYNVFKERRSGGKALSKSGDRGSYTESLAAMQAQYGRDVSARNFEMGFVGVLAAPFAVYALAEAGVVGLVSNGYTAVNTYLTNAGIQSAIALNTAKNVAVDAIGGAIVQYGPSTMAFSGGLYSLLQKGYGFTVDGSTIYNVIKFIGGSSGAGVLPSGVPGYVK
jgi:RHS repeat-associated protein